MQQRYRYVRLLWWLSSGFFLRTDSTIDAFPVAKPSPTSLRSCLRSSTEARYVSSALYAHESKEILTLKSSFTTDSGTVHEVDKYALVSFFHTDECRDLLLSAGGTGCVHDVPLDMNLLRMWRIACDDYGPHCLPNDGDRIVSSIKTIELPGLTLETTIYTGVKFHEHGSGGYPEYEFLLIASKRRAFGPTPLVWLFKQLTGTAGLAPDSFSPSDARVKTRAYIDQEADDKSDDRLIIKVVCDFEIRVVFPRMLVRLLPTSKQRMEEQGSASILKAVVSDITNGVMATRQHFLERYQSVGVAI